MSNAGKEIWKNVKNYNGYYEISNFGRVRSWNVVGKGKYKSDKPKILKLCKNTHGYLRLTLYNNNKGKTETIHRLVAKHFIPNPDNKLEINHKDGDKTNNHVYNLEWCTSSENQKHCHDNNLQKKLVGEECLLSKLTEKDVLDIRNVYRLNCFTQKELANAWNVNRKTIYNIVNKRTWKHV